MDFLKKNMQKQETKAGSNSKVTEAENGWLKAKKAIDDAIYELGKVCFEANKEHAAPEFTAQVEAIHAKVKEEYLWHQYRLSLDEQRMCDSCHSIITADSAFCNRCGAAVAPIDFSSITGTAENTNQEKCCPKCGKPFAEGSVFCESCGTKIG